MGRKTLKTIHQPEEKDLRSLLRRANPDLSKKDEDRCMAKIDEAIEDAVTHAKKPPKVSRH